MKYEQCFACDYCDINKTNEHSRVKCKKFDTYVDMYNGCDDYEDKKIAKMFSECFKK